MWCHRNWRRASSCSMSGMWMCTSWRKGRRGINDTWRSTRRCSPSRSTLRTKSMCVVLTFLNCCYSARAEYGVGDRRQFSALADSPFPSQFPPSPPSHLACPLAVSLSRSLLLIIPSIRHSRNSSWTVVSKTFGRRLLGSTRRRSASAWRARRARRVWRSSMDSWWRGSAGWR